MPAIGENMSVIAPAGTAPAAPANSFSARIGTSSRACPRCRVRSSDVANRTCPCAVVTTVPAGTVIEPSAPDARKNVASPTASSFGLRVTPRIATTWSSEVPVAESM